MNCKEAKLLSIISYLKRCGRIPIKTYGKYVMFNSPFRNEKTPSFKVDLEKNLWYDFGAGIGGTIIDLIMYLRNCSAKEALEILSNDSFLFHQHIKPVKKETQFSVIKLVEIENKNLLMYLEERKLNIDFVRQYCHQIHYTFDNKKEYYGIGFMNNLGSFEIRNKFFKGCYGRKYISTISNKSNTVCLFESWSDFLSYLTLKNEIPHEDFIVLNSTTLVKLTKELLQKYTTLKVFFDNDESGNTALKFIQDNAQHEVIDCSVHYSEYNDLNDYLQSSKNKRWRA